MCAGSLRGQIGLLRGEVLGGQLLPLALGHLLHHLDDTACRRCCLLLQQRCISKERCISLALRPGTSAAILDKGCSSRPCSRQAGYRSRCALPNHGEEADEHRCDQQQRLSMLLQLAVRTIQMEQFSRAGHVRHCVRVLCCRAAVACAWNRAGPAKYKRAVLAMQTWAFGININRELLAPKRAPKAFSDSSAAPAAPGGGASPSG